MYKIVYVSNNGRFILLEIISNNDDITKMVLEQFYSLVHVDEYHNLKEERILPYHYHNRNDTW